MSLSLGLGLHFGIIVISDIFSHKIMLACAHKGSWHSSVLAGLSELVFDVLSLLSVESSVSNTGESSSNEVLCCLLDLYF